MATVENNKHAVSGKIVLVFFILGLVVCSGALFFGFITRMDAAERDQMVQQITQKEYAAVKLQVDKYIEDHDYVKAIHTLQKFLTKFSYRNEYKEMVEKQIEELKQQARKEM